MEVALAPQNTATAQVEPASEEELFRLQLSVAKRADELARGANETRGVESDRKTWLLAETQVLPTFGPALAG
jgi:uncharacterized protein HemX